MGLFGEAFLDSMEQFEALWVRSHHNEDIGCPNLGDPPTYRFEPRLVIPVSRRGSLFAMTVDYAIAKLSTQRGCNKLKKTLKYTNPRKLLKM